MLHLINQTKLLFREKMYTNSNVLLYTLSCYAGVPSRFTAVASQYGVHSLQQTVGSVKFAVGKSFTETVHSLSRIRVFCFVFCTLLLCVSSVFYVCILCCYLLV